MVFGSGESGCEWCCNSGVGSGETGARGDDVILETPLAADCMGHAKALAIVSLLLLLLLLLLLDLAVVWLAAIIALFIELWPGITSSDATLVDQLLDARGPVGNSGS